VNNSAVVICTRNRATDISRCLESVFAQTYIPDIVLIVDSSDNDETEIVTMRPQFERATYVRAERGLTIQRNAALELLSREKVSIVHFIDDDVLLDENYFQEMEKGLKDNDEASGVTATIREISRTPAKSFEKLALLNSDQPGKVLKSGINIGSYSHPQVVEVDWLPGCCMTFNLVKIAGLRFDESRSGYAMGEDVDFSLKAKSRGPLYHLPFATLLHNLSQVNRHDSQTLIEMEIRNRWKLAIDHPKYVQKFWVAHSIILSSAYFLFIGIRNFHGEYIKRAAASLNTLGRCVIGYL